MIPTPLFNSRSRSAQVTDLRIRFALTYTQRLMKRRSVRALLITPDSEVLLMQVRVHGKAGVVWILPGGGREPGETPAQTLQREIFEETGLQGVKPGPHIWTSHSKFFFNSEVVQQTSDYYVCKVSKYEAKSVHLDPGDESDGFIGFRWWTLADIATSQENFGPRNLAEVLQSLRDNGLPGKPITLGNWDFVNE